MLIIILQIKKIIIKLIQRSLLNIDKLKYFLKLLACSHFSNAIKLNWNYKLGYFDIPILFLFKNTYSFGILSGFGLSEIFFESFVISNNSLSIFIVLFLFSISLMMYICNSSKLFICSQAFWQISDNEVFNFSKASCS